MVLGQEDTSGKLVGMNKETLEVQSYIVKVILCIKHMLYATVGNNFFLPNFRKDNDSWCKKFNMLLQ